MLSNPNSLSQVDQTDLPPSYQTVIRNKHLFSPCNNSVEEESGESCPQYDGPTVIINNSIVLGVIRPSGPSSTRNQNDGTGNIGTESISPVDIISTRNIDVESGLRRERFNQTRRTFIRVCRRA